MKNLLILGASKNGADLTFIIDSFEYLRNEWRIIGYLDDNDELNNKEFCGHPVLGKFKDYCKFSNDTYYFLSPGSPSTYFKREKMVRDLDIPLEKYASIYPPDMLLNNTKIGYGVMIMPGVNITRNVKIGNHVIIHTNTMIPHDVIIGDFSFLSASVNIGGAVIIGKSVYCGLSSTLMPKIKIDDYALIGMGAVVLKDVKSKEIIAGNPGRVLKKININD